MPPDHRWQQWRHEQRTWRGGRLRVWWPDAATAQQHEAWLLALLERTPHEHGGQTLQGGRNVVSAHQPATGGSVVLKDFGLRHVQPLIYAIRSSKAQRAARAALLLAAAGVNTPAALAVVDYSRWGLLRRSLLLTAAVPEAQTLRAALQTGALDTATLIPRLGTMIAAVHRAGLHHADLTAANVLLDAAQDLWLIDNNRLRTMALSESEAVAAIAKLSLPDELWPTFLSGYRPQATAGWITATTTALITQHRAFRERGQRRRQARRGRQR